MNFPDCILLMIFEYCFLETIINVAKSGDVAFKRVSSLYNQMTLNRKILSFIIRHSNVHQLSYKPFIYGGIPRAEINGTTNDIDIMIVHKDSHYTNTISTIKKLIELFFEGFKEIKHYCSETLRTKVLGINIDLTILSQSAFESNKFPIDADINSLCIIETEEEEVYKRIYIKELLFDEFFMFNETRNLIERKIQEKRGTLYIFESYKLYYRLLKLIFKGFIINVDIKDKTYNFGQDTIRHVFKLFFKFSMDRINKICEKYEFKCGYLKLLESIHLKIERLKTKTVIVIPKCQYSIDNEFNIFSFKDRFTNPKNYKQLSGVKSYKKSKKIVYSYHKYDRKPEEVYCYDKFAELKFNELLETFTQEVYTIHAKFNEKIYNEYNKFMVFSGLIKNSF